ncbi:MAG: WXG100 family type VII secretion target [Nocardioides sp.]|uniref:WXG100 family type VII secretion target n=1 Tax=Nocardioides sp. TaxID=35761 RepID=UPI003D6AECDF
MTDMDTTVHGSPESVRKSAEACTTAIDVVGDSIADSSKAERSASSWHGQAGAAFESRIADHKSHLRNLESRLEGIRKGLTAFADDLESVERKMIGIREEARGASLTVDGTFIRRPVASGAAEGGDEQAVDAHNDKVKVWDDLVTRVESARINEDQAHESLDKAIEKSTGDGWIENLFEKLQLLPPDFPSGATLGAFIFGVGGLATGAAVDFMVKSRYGTFHPRPAHGGFGPPQPLRPHQRFKAHFSENNWDSKAGKGALRNKWNVAGKVATKAGWVVTGVTSGVDQWQKDSDDPTLSNTEKSARAASTGLITAGGAAAGAWGGAQLGGAIGTMICPGAGTVIGGAVGGLIGGAVGSGAAGWVADKVADTAGELGGAAADAVGSALEDAGDVAEDVGDTLTFWD